MADNNGAYEEIIGVQLDPEQWKSSLSEAESQYDEFIRRLNSKEFSIAGNFEGGGDLGGITNQITALAESIAGIKKMFSDVFGAGEEAAVQSSSAIKTQVEEVANVAIASERKQTEAVVRESAKRTEVRTKETREAESLQKKLKSAVSSRPAKQFESASRSAAQLVPVELDRHRQEVTKAEQQAAAQDAEENKAYAAREKQLQKEHDAAIQQGFAARDAEERETAKRQKEEERQRVQDEKEHDALQKKLKSASGPTDEETFQAASMSARQSLEKELDRQQSQAQKEYDLRQRGLRAATGPTDEENFQAASMSARKSLEKELDRHRVSMAEQEEMERRRGVGGFFRGVGSGLTMNTGSAGDMGEFIGDVIRFSAAWGAVGVAMRAAGAAIQAPFEAVKNGIQFLSQMQETASQLKAGLLESVQFSADPAKNMEMASKAADVLTRKMEDLAAKLNTTIPKIQTGFQTFSEFGGNNLTRNLGESLNVSAIATAALQAQNPNLPQRQVASELAKLVAGTVQPTSKLAAALGISADKLNEMVAHARQYHDLNEEIIAAAPGLVERLSAADGRMGSLVATLGLIKDRIEAAFAKPIFDTLIETLRQLKQLWDGNKDAITTIGTTAGNVIGDLIKSLVNINNISFSPLIQSLQGVLSFVEQISTGLTIVFAHHERESEKNALKQPYDDLKSRLGYDGAVPDTVANLDASAHGHNELAIAYSKYKQDFSTKAPLIDEKYDQIEAAAVQHNKDAHLAMYDPSGFKKQQDAKKADDYKFWAARAEHAVPHAQLPKTYEDFQKNPAAVQKFMQEHGKSVPALPDDLGNDLALNFQKTTHGILGGKVVDQVAKIRTEYETAKKDIVNAEADFRKTVDSQVTAGTKTLSDAAKEKADSLDREASKITQAGAKYSAALKAANVKGTSVKSAEALQGSINESTIEAYRNAATGKSQDTAKVAAQSHQVDEIYERSQAPLTQESIRQRYSLKSEDRQRGVRDPLLAAQDKHDEEAELLSAQIASLQKEMAALKPNDKPGRTRIQGQIDQAQQKATLNDQDWARQHPQVLLEQMKQGQQQRVSSDELRVNFSEGIEQQDKHKQPIDGLRDQAVTLQSKNTELVDKIAMLNTTLNNLISQVKEEAEKNGQDANKAVDANASVQKTKHQLGELQVQQMTVQHDLSQNQHDQNAISKFGQGVADKFFGAGGGEYGDSHFDNLTDASHSLSSAANNIAGGVGNIMSAYQQGGIGAAVGSGLQTVGSMIPGPAGAVIGAIGSLTSMFSGLFTAAAQEIGREVAKAVDKIMEKYSTGQIPLVQAIQQVQEEINHLITSESGKKGGQQVIDNELPQLQQTLDSLKYQQQQEKWNFQDMTIEGSSTNSVTQQWLTDWININKQVYEYQKAVGSAGDSQIAKYLNEEMQQQQVNLQNQYNQGQTTAINDALQLNQLLQQRNNYEDQYRKQQFDILSSDSLQRRGNPAIQAAQKLSLAKSQYDQETQQMNFQISMTQQKVDLEKQIFDLATDTATLQSEALTAQNYQLKQQMAQYQAIAQLLAETAGATYSNGSWNIPSGITTGDGGPFGIPGTGGAGTVDNSTSSQNITVNVTAPIGTDAGQFGSDIVKAIQYKLRIAS